MKFYMASGFQNKAMVKSLTASIKRVLNWELTYDWTMNPKADTVESLMDIGKKEFQAVLDSDIVIIVLPGGKGCHTELGIALGSGKRILLYDPDNLLADPNEATTFYYLTQVTRWNGMITDLMKLV
jgi:hypothetical protein